MTLETQIIIGMAAAWFAACGVYAIRQDVTRLRAGDAAQSNLLFHSNHNGGNA